MYAGSISILLHRIGSRLPPSSVLVCKGVSLLFYMAGPNTTQTITVRVNILASPQGDLDTIPLEFRGLGEAELSHFDGRFHGGMASLFAGDTRDRLKFAVDGSAAKFIFASLFEGSNLRRIELRFRLWMQVKLSIFSAVSLLRS